MPILILDGTEERAPMQTALPSRNSLHETSKTLEQEELTKPVDLVTPEPRRVTNTQWRAADSLSVDQIDRDDNALTLTAQLPTSTASPTFTNPWRTAIPAEQRTQQDFDLSFPGERHYYRSPHSM